jgi:uncharacterized protein YjbJ (UPF0337 family)
MSAWNRLLARAKQTWGELTDDDLLVVRGNLEELIASIEERTGEAADTIRERLAVIQREISDFDEDVDEAV